MSNTTLVSWALLTGAIGDFLLQMMVKQGMGQPDGWGLKPYFARHGPAESIFLAAGMMGLFYAAYVALGLPLNLVWLAVYGILLDLAFRVFRIFPSLDGYYQHLNYFWSAVWGAIPLVVPFLLWKKFQK